MMDILGAAVRIAIITLGILLVVAAVTAAVSAGLMLSGFGPSMLTAATDTPVWGLDGTRSPAAPPLLVRTFLDALGPGTASGLLGFGSLLAALLLAQAAIATFARTVRGG